MLLRRDWTVAQVGQQRLALIVRRLVVCRHARIALAAVSTVVTDCGR